MAWSVLGWEAAFFSEIEPFPCAVLAHHHPNVPNHGDMTLFQDWPDDAIDLLVGGTPCQSFSIAGLRAGLADPRGNLMLTYLAIAARYRPRWLVWENVPGVLSSAEGRDFGTFLAGMAELGYGFAYRVLDAQFCRAYGFAGAVPQRRRRVFVVGYLGDWRRAAAVLFDGASLRGDSPPRRQAGQVVAPTISSRPTGGGGLGTDFDLDGGLIHGPSVSPALKARDAKGPSSDGDGDGAPLLAVAHALRAEGFDASEDGTGRGTPVIPIDMRQASRGATMTNNRPKGSSGGAAGTGIGEIGDPSPTVATSHTPAIAIQAGAARENPDSGPDGVGVREDGAAYTIEARAEVQAVAWSIMPQNSGKDYKARAVEVAQPVMAGGPVGGNQGGDYIQEAWAVRRLTPTECERLQGFPDGYTAIPYRKKPAADGPRYKALGNSMAVNVMRVIGSRIAQVEAA